MHNPQTPNSQAVIVNPAGEPMAWFDDVRDAMVYVVGYTGGRLGVFVSTGVPCRDGRSIIRIQIGA